MLNAGWFSHFFTTVNDFPLSIPPATGYFSVRILPLHTIYTTATLNRTTALSLVNKNAALEILFIMMEEMGSCMAGTSMLKKKRNLTYAETEVWSLFKYTEVLRK